MKLYKKYDRIEIVLSKNRGDVQMSAFYESLKSFFGFVASQIRYMGWADIIDILILSVCLFYVYKFIRDRRAVKLAVGIALISAVKIASDVFEMQAIKFILENFFQVGIILLIIVFQPELRSALEKMGGKPLEGFKGFGSDSKDNELAIATIDSICEAIFDLAREKTGALIVIERSTKLGEFIRSGVVVNAQANSALIKNIFFNKAPLHDGAVVIRDKRIYAAGCLLPLATKNNITKELGTRHRAAIGASEASDALVVVVSEETGTISIAHKGHMHRGYDVVRLKAKLDSILVQEKVKRKPVVKIKRDQKGREDANGKQK